MTQDGSKGVSQGYIGHGGLLASELSSEMLSTHLCHR